MSSGAKGEECVLWIGPGRRLGDLMPLLAAISKSRSRCQAGSIAELGAHPPAGLVLIDADLLRAEDILDLQRFVSRSSSADVILLGDDAGRRGVRGLLRSERVRWMCWPPDVEDMYAIVAAPGEERFSAPLDDAAREDWPASAPRAATRAHDEPPIGATAPIEDRLVDEDRVGRSAGSSPLSADIAEIERVLGSTGGGERAPQHQREVESEVSPDSDVAFQETRLDDADQDHRDSVHSPPPRAAAVSAERPSMVSGARPSQAPHEAFRAQVADLADIAQRIELSLLGLREAEEDPSDEPSAAAALESVAREVARLVQFARTLGYLVSPPGPGSQLFDLTEMLEVFLSEIRSGGPDAPRCLLRSNGVLNVLSDRQLLSQAFDALFFMARSAAARGEILRVQTRREEESGRHWARVSIDFPGGKLLELPSSAILEPYGLRRILPDLGPNALSAAMRIIEGQGGRCRLEPQARGRLEWTVMLPLAPTTGDASPVGSSSIPAVEGGRSVRAEDPFA